MFCSNCGCPLAERDLFCSACGKPNPQSSNAANVPPPFYAYPQPPVPPRNSLWQQMPPQQSPAAPPQAFVPAQPYASEPVSPAEFVQANVTEPVVPTEPVQPQAYEPSRPTEPVQPQAYEPARPNEPVQQNAYEAYPFTAPVQPAPEQPVKNTPPKERVKPTTGSKVWTVVLCIVLSLLLLLTSTIGIVRGMLDEDTIVAALEDSDIAALEFEYDGTDYTAAEYIHENLDDKTQRIISKKAIRRLLNAEELHEFVADVVTGYTDYFTEDERIEPIDTDKIIDFLRDNRYLIESETGYYLSSQDFEDIAWGIDNMFDFSSVRSGGRIEQYTGVSLAAPRFFLSPLGYGLMILLCVMCVVGIFLTNRKHLYAGLPKLFITLLVFGSLYLLIALGCWCVTMIDIHFYVTAAAAFICQLAVAYLLRGGICFVVGLGGFLTVRKYNQKLAAK